MKEFEHIDKEIEEIEKTLKQVTDEIGRIDVPEGYFGDLKADILSQTTEKKSTVKVIRISSWVAAAACIALALYLIPFDTEVAPASIVEAPEPVLDEYYFDEEDVEEFALLEEEDAFSTVTVELTEDELADYFEDNGIDIEDLQEDI